jgi:hypothetical protein
MAQPQPHPLVAIGRRTLKQDANRDQGWPSLRSIGTFCGAGLKFLRISDGSGVFTGNHP